VDPRTRERFNPLDRGRIRERQDFRGFDVRPRPAAPPANPLARPAPRPPASAPAHPLARPAAPQRPPAGASPIAPVSRDNALRYSNRGRESLRPMPPAPSAPSSPPRGNR
jgi:hypothetical protein